MEKGLDEISIWEDDEIDNILFSNYMYIFKDQIGEGRLYQTHIEFLKKIIKTKFKNNNDLKKFVELYSFLPSSNIFLALFAFIA